MNRIGAADCCGRGLGDPDVAHIARLHHVGDRADRVLDRHRRVDAGRLIQVDVVGAEAGEAVGEERLHRVGRGVQSEPFSVRTAQRAEAHRDEGTLAPSALEGFLQQHLVLAHAVHVGGIEHGDAGLERGMDRGDAFAVVGRPVPARHAHAAQTDLRDNRSVAAKLVRPHTASSHVTLSRFDWSTKRLFGTTRPLN
jgi:hypothetical protein